MPLKTKKTLFLFSQPDAVRAIVDAVAAAPDKDLAMLLEGFTWTFEKISRETEEEKKRRVDDDGKRATKKGSDGDGDDRRGKRSRRPQNLPFFPP